MDPEVRRDLRGLSKEGSEFVGAHLFMAGMLAEEDPALAWRHARAARSKGGRIAVVRETVGLVAYHAGEWAEAISELRAARRMTGGPGQLPVMADCERALGHPEKAIELSRSAEAADLDPSSAAELRIVVAGARADLGQLDAAIAHLEGALKPENIEPFSARLFYAYADLLLQADRRAEAVDWFMKAAEVDVDEETGAGERLTELADENDETPDDTDEIDGLGNDLGDENRTADDNVEEFGDDREVAASVVGATETSMATSVAADLDEVPAGESDDSYVADALDDADSDDDVLDEDEESSDLERPSAAADVVTSGDSEDDDLDEASADVAAGLESNAAAGEEEDRYAANDMDAEDDTDDAPIRPTNPPRSMGSLFSHNEGGL